MGKEAPSMLWAYRTAYKITIGTTPFNLVFGLDAILPIEFLVPTLRNANTLQWIGHELLDRIEYLEKLDERRLQLVAGLYAEKRRQKQWHDRNVRSK